MEIPEFDTLVVCKTFNHAKYITDALNGFVMQKTSFPYICMIMDDASTDGEPEVIKNFLAKECLMEDAVYLDHVLADIVIVNHKTNINCKFAVYFLKTNLYNTDKKIPLINEWRAHCNYEALCEGDDFWTDPYKLEKQISFMEKHPEIDICAHSCVIRNQLNGKQTVLIHCNTECIIPVEDVIIGGGNFVGTASLIYRLSFIERHSRFRDFLDFDYTLQIDGSIRGGMGYLPECMSVYRYLVPGSWSVRSQDSTEYLSFLNDKKQMFSILDSEFNGRFHKAIMARLLKDEISANASGVTNRKALTEYSEGFRILPLKAKIRILMKCYANPICNFLNIK